MKRILTAAIAIPFALITTLYAPDWLFALIVGLVAALMLEEFLTLGAALQRSRPPRWFLIAGAAVAMSFALGPVWVVTTFAASVLCLMTVSISAGDIERIFVRVTLGLSGLAYCSILFGFVILLSRDAVLTLFAIIWAGDTAAYYGGRMLGRRPLAPKVSPKKTVEGALAGLVASTVAGAVIGVWRLHQPWMTIAMISALTAIAGQIGDLAESSLKRSAGVKDSSSILPGHGGILDRLDSLLFAAPAFYWLLRV